MIRRGGAYYYGRGIPKSLRRILGKREILVRLKTSDKDVAKAHLHREALQAEPAAKTCARLMAFFGVAIPLAIHEETR